MALGLRSRSRPAARQGHVLEQARLNWPGFLAQREHVIRMDRWMTGEQLTLEDSRGADMPDGGQPYTPRDRDAEYEDLASRSPNQFGRLVVKTLAQTAHVKGAALPGSQDNVRIWDAWQENRMDSRQIAINRAAAGHGIAYGLALPGRSPLTGDRTAKMSAFSGKRMAAWYDQDEEDEWPVMALLGDPVPGAIDGEWTVRLYDDQVIHYLSCKGLGYETSDWTYISSEVHGLGVTPIVRFGNEFDLDGRAMGEIEPIIPLLRRIDQTTFDRLIVQRFGAWKVRYITGMAKPEDANEEQRQKLALKITDLLISDDPNSKFGTLDETDIKHFIESGDTDLRYLSAVSQTPPHHLLGLSSNLQAEALATAEGGLMRKSADFKMVNGESYEQWLRLAAMIKGYTDEARAFDMQIRWRDMESRSMIQAINALGIAATTLKVPLEMLWERIPDFTDGDVERAKKLVEEGTFDRLLAELETGLGGADNDPTEQPALTGG